MKYHVGDLVKVVVETRKNNRRYIVIDMPVSDSKLITAVFQVVAKIELTQSYKIIVDDDITGWTISQFHIDHEGIPKAFNGKRFYDIPESAIIGIEGER